MNNYIVTYAKTPRTFTVAYFFSFSKFFLLCDAQIKIYFINFFEVWDKLKHRQQSLKHNEISLKI